MSDYRYFDETGNEMFTKPQGELTDIGQIGGSPDKSTVILYVESEMLDRTIVSQLLEVQPDLAWNPGEKHPYGPPHKKYTRAAKWGRWRLQSEKDDLDIETKINLLLDKCSKNLNHWIELSNKYEVCLTIVGYFSNWNRELFFSKSTLKAIHERSINLKCDIYLLGDSDSKDAND